MGIHVSYDGMGTKLWKYPYPFGCTGIKLWEFPYPLNPWELNYEDIHFLWGYGNNYGDIHIPEDMELKLWEYQYPSGVWEPNYGGYRT